MRMNRLFPLIISALLLAMTATAQTLADRAREQRKDKRTATSNQRVYTNESLNLRPAPSIAEPLATAKKSAEDAAAAEEDGDSEKAKARTPDEEKAKLAAEFKDQIDKAKTELTQLQREADVNQREGRLKAAVFYADAGAKLRDEKKYAAEESKARAELADKQKKITDLLASLEKMRESARRAGIPAGMIP